MRITRDEWLAKVEKAKVDKIAPMRPQFEMLRQAAVHANLLSGHEEWDRFLSYIQAFVETTEAQLKGLSDAVVGAKMVDPQEIMATKLLIAECTGRRDALNGILSLPKDIIAMGAQAKTLLDRLPEA